MSKSENKTTSRWEAWKEKLSIPYRLVVINDETFQEVNTTRLTLGNLYAILSTALVVMAIIVFLLFAFTPLKRFIPGYGDFESNERAVQLEEKVVELEKELASYESWTENIRKILVGDVDTLGTTGLSAITTPDQPPADRNLNINKIPADEALRQAIGEEEQIAPARTVSLTNKEKPLEQLFFTPPVSGEVTFHFSLEKKHYGTDIAAPRNTPVKAVMGGFVISSDWTLETGNTICIQHQDNLVSFYKHNSVLLKKTGDIVKAGEAIAIIGNTGDHSTGPHLHFELWHKGHPIDAADYVNFN